MTSDLVFEPNDLDYNQDYNITDIKIMYSSIVQCHNKDYQHTTA